MILFWIAIGILAASVSLLSMRISLSLYLIGALIFPSLWFGKEEVALMFEVIYCLWLVFVFFLRKSGSGFTFRWHPVLSRYGLFPAVVILSTMLAQLSIASEGSLLQLLISFYGILRPLLVMFLFLNVQADEKFARRILWAFVLLSVPIALLSIGQTLGLSVAQKITLRGYTSPWRTPVFRLLEEQGVIIRSTGVFESPVYNAVYWLLVLITTGFALLTGSPTFGSKRFLYLAFGLAVLAGITTLSATFLAGAVLVMATLVLFLGYRYPRRFFRFALGSAAIVSIFIVVGLPYLARQPTFARNLGYQVDRILSGTLFFTRYDPESGILAGTYETIQQRLFIGWGLIEHEGAFVGDSIYTSVLYRGGVVGISIFLWVIYGILKHAWQNRYREGVQGEIAWSCLLWSLVLLVAGVGSPSFFVLRLQEWYWALVGISLNRGLVLQVRKDGLSA